MVKESPTDSVRFYDGQGTVTVSDGRLSIGNGPTASNNKVCFVDIFTAPAVVESPKLNPPTLAGGNPAITWTHGGTLESAPSPPAPGPAPATAMARTPRRPAPPRSSSASNAEPSPDRGTREASCPGCRAGGIPFRGAPPSPFPQAGGAKAKAGRSRWPGIPANHPTNGVWGAAPPPPPPPIRQPKSPRNEPRSPKEKRRGRVHTLVADGPFPSGLRFPPILRVSGVQPASSGTLIRGTGVRLRPCVAEENPTAERRAGPGSIPYRAPC